MPPELFDLVEQYHQDFETKVEGDTQLYHTNGDPALLKENKRDVARMRIFSEFIIRRAYHLGYKAGKK